MATPRPAHLALGRADESDVSSRTHALAPLLLYCHRDGLAWSLCSDGRPLSEWGASQAPVNMATFSPPPIQVPLPSKSSLDAIPLPGISLPHPSELHYPPFSVLALSSQRAVIREHHATSPLGFDS